MREAGITSLYSESERGVGNMQDNPALSREQIDRLRSVAQLRSVRSGEVLYEPSCPDVPLFVVLDRTVATTRAGEDEKILAVRDPSHELPSRQSRCEVRFNAYFASACGLRTSANL